MYRPEAHCTARPTALAGLAARVGPAPARISHSRPDYQAALEGPSRLPSPVHQGPRRNPGRLFHLLSLNKWTAVIHLFRGRNSREFVRIFFLVSLVNESINEPNKSNNTEFFVIMFYCYQKIKGRL